LRNIFIIVLMQVAFDLVTPQISMAAHLGGLSTGFLLGLIVPARSQY
jgi:membrane associated rhomboid family serine protease